MPDLRVPPEAAGERGIAGRLLSSTLALAESLQTHGGLGAAGVVSERFEKCLLGRVEPIGRQRGLAPNLHVVRAVAPGMEIVIAFRLLHTSIEQLEPLVHGVGLAKQ